MPLIPVNNAGEIGVISVADRAPHELPLNAWTAARNVRVGHGVVQRMLGHQQVYGTPTIAPYHLLPVLSGGTFYWITAGLTKVHVWDGNTHNNITRQPAGVDVDYSAAALTNWTSGVLGGIPILNNGADVPQFWSPVSVGQRLQNLTNWDANHRAAALRVFKRFLVAMDVTKSGVRYPQKVKWSHPADAGAVPVSWNEADDTKDAGEYDLLGSNGALLDGTPMRDQFVLYKEDSVHWMQFVGGTEVFRFPSMFDNWGILSRRCAVEYAKGRHAVFALGDIIVHDGQSWDSIVDSKTRKFIFNQMDPSNYPTSFVALVPTASEVWFCFPTIGQMLPNLALVWNYKYNSTGFRDLSGIAHIGRGVITTTSDTWDADTGTWDSDGTVWNTADVSPAGFRLLGADPGATKLFWMDNTNQFAGVDYTAYIERMGLALPTDPDGPPDMRQRRFISGIWPRITGTVGGVVKVYVGTQEAPEAPVSWKGAKNYIIGTTKFIPYSLNTRLLAIRFESTAAIEWKLSGYEVDVKPAGTF